MRNSKKLLVVICVLALLTVSFVFAAFAAEAGTVEELNALIATAEAENDANAKYTATLAVAEYLNTRKISTTEAGYDEAVANAHKLSVDAAVLLLNKVDVNGVTADNAYDGMLKADELLGCFELSDDVAGYADAKVKYDAALERTVGLLLDKCDAKVEENLKTAENHAAISKVRNVLDKCTPYAEAGLSAELTERFATLDAAQRNAVAKNFVLLDASNRISNYDLPVYLVETWEKASLGYATTIKSTVDWSVDNKGIANQLGVQKETNGNRYFVHRYLEKAAPAASYAQVTLSKLGVTDAVITTGIVFEFDITTFGDFPEKGMHIETGSVESAYFPPPYFYINSEGDICKNDKNTVVLKGAIVPGQWTHITLVLDPETYFYQLYVEGQFVAEYDAKHQNGIKYDYSKVAFRISGDPSTYGEIAVDNITVYGGDSYRIHDRLETMTDDEKFSFYVDYLVDENNLVAERSLAYDVAKPLLDNYWVVDENGVGSYTEAALASPELKAAVDTYLAFDIETFLDEVKLRNLDGYINLVKNLESISRETSTAAQRKSIIADIAAYLEKNGELINRELDSNNDGVSDFHTYDAIVSKISREATYDANALDFIRYIERFEAAQTLTAKQRNYNKAVELAENDGIDIAFIFDEDHPDRSKFTALLNAYDVYRNADKVIYVLTKDNNSKKIVQCINKINIYTTEEEWVANRAFMEEYLMLLRDIVVGVGVDGEPLYDPEYAGIDEALAFYHESYAFFYALLQEEHIAYISELLGLVQQTDAYIEKMGLIALAENYVLVQDINYEDARILELLNYLDTAKAELELREADYASLLKQNAVYFKNLVERMRTAQTYDEQVKYLNEAYLLYFYIDVTVEGTNRAVEIFDEYKLNLDRIAESSVKFLEAVALYKACETEDEKYAALVECYYNAQFVEMSYEGAEEAMAEYLAAYNAYMGYVEAVNAEITVSANAVGSLRANCGITNVIAIIIKKLFGN